MEAWLVFISRQLPVGGFISVKPSVPIAHARADHGVYPLKIGNNSTFFRPEVGFSEAGFFRIPLNLLANGDG
jgi:hypothetical protein